MNNPDSDESFERDRKPSGWRRGLARALRATGQKISGEAAVTGGGETILVPGFPNLFGCASHRPASTHFLRWNQPLHPEYEFRRTIDQGRTWSLSLDTSYDDVAYVIIDLSWASNTLRELGVAINDVPLVAVQTWFNLKALTATDDCTRCHARLDQLDELVITHLTGDQKDLNADLPPAPKLRWSDPPSEIALAVLADLHARSILGESITVLEGTAEWDLLSGAPTYLQLMLTNEGSLKIEARKDFSYWKKEIDQPRVDRLLAAGFSEASGFGNFEILHGPDPLGLFHQDLLTDAITAFVDVYEPRPKKIKIERIEGASPFESQFGSTNYPFFQRLIDRMSRPDLLSASTERLNELESSDDTSLLELIETISPSFARIIKLSHLDELVDYLDDLLILAPVGFEESMCEMADDPLASLEDLSDFALRHIIRTSDMRERFVQDEDRPANEFLLDIQSLAHERLLLGKEDDVPTSVNGIPLDGDAALEADNGVVIPYPGWIDPPALPGLVIPKLD